MHSALLYHLAGRPDGDGVTQRLDDNLPAVTVEELTYLDGSTLFHGTAAARIDYETRVPMVGDSTIVTVTEEKTKRTQTDWYADIGNQWAGITSGDGEFFLRILEREHGVDAQEKHIDLEHWAENILLANNGEVWGVNYSETNNAGDSVRAGSGFHQDADIDHVRNNLSELSGLGFNYEWDDIYVRGSIFESGYVSVFRSWTEELFGRWLTKHVLPYTAYEGQSELNQRTLADNDTDSEQEERGGVADV